MMDVIEKQTSGVKHIKTMAEMSEGEVCVDTESGDFILKVGHYDMAPICLILNCHKYMDSYQGDSDRPVRPLMDGESITIRFS